jgi:hypothetical protein
MTASATQNQVPEIFVWWPGDATDPIEIDLLDPSYLSNHYVAKMLSWLANISPSFTEQLIAMEKFVSESGPRDCLALSAVPGIIA